jgi:hypothetical protein
MACPHINLVLLASTGTPFVVVREMQVAEDLVGAGRSLAIHVRGSTSEASNDAQWCKLCGALRFYRRVPERHGWSDWMLPTDRAQ